MALAEKTRSHVETHGSFVPATHLHIFEAPFSEEFHLGTIHIFSVVRAFCTLFATTICFGFNCDGDRAE